jgi:hypothetical protein
MFRSCRPEDHVQILRYTLDIQHRTVTSLLVEPTLPLLYCLDRLEPLQMSSQQLFPDEMIERFDGSRSPNACQVLKKRRATRFA